MLDNTNIFDCLVCCSITLIYKTKVNPKCTDVNTSDKWLTTWKLEKDKILLGHAKYRQVVARACRMLTNSKPLADAKYWQVRSC